MKSYLRFSTAAGFVLLMAFTIVSYAGPKTPKEIEGVTIVDTSQVMAAQESGSALLLDFRSKGLFRKGTLPGAMNCPGIKGKPANLDSDEVRKAENVVSSCGALTGVDKGQEVITFCKGARCWISPKGSLAMKNLGYTNVKWFRGGTMAWDKAGHSFEK